MTENDVKKLFCALIREIGEPMFNHNEQKYFIALNEDLFINFENNLKETLQNEAKNIQ